MKPRTTLVAACLGAAVLSVAAIAAPNDTEVQPLSEEELTSVLDTIESTIGGSWSDGYQSGVEEFGVNIANFIIPRLSRSGDTSAEAVAALDKALKELMEEMAAPSPAPEGNMFDGKAAGSIAIATAFGDLARSSVEDELISAEAAEQLATGAKQMSSRTTADSLMSNTIRGLSSGSIVSRGLANNRAMSDSQVERMVSALEGLKEAMPDQADAIDIQIFKVARLTIGREAPNIVGIDTDEVEFELKDYLGKVVVIDFWGDW